MIYVLLQRFWPVQVQLETRGGEGAARRGEAAGGSAGAALPRQLLGSLQRGGCVTSGNPVVRS